MKLSKQLDQGVYFILAPNQDKVKIGKSRDIKLRFINLRTGFMDEGVLLFGILTDNESGLETALKAMFSHIKADREWFILTRELKDYLLKCNSIYSKIAKYNDFDKLQKHLAYSSLEMYKLNVYLKLIRNKLLVPFIFFIGGLILAYSNYKLEHEKEGNLFLQYWSYILLVVYPIYMPILSKQIMAYGTPKMYILFLYFVFSMLALEILHVVFHFDANIINTIRIIHISACFPFTKQVITIILLEKDKERIKKNIGSNLYVNNDEFALQLKRSEVSQKLIKVQRVARNTFLLSSSILYVILNIFLVFSNIYQWDTKLPIFLILNVGAILFIFLHVSLKLKKIKPYIVSTTLLLILNIPLFIDRESQLYWDIFRYFIFIYFPTIVVIAITTFMEKNYKTQIVEIDDKLSTISLNNSLKV